MNIHTIITKSYTKVLIKQNRIDIVNVAEIKIDILKRINEDNSKILIDLSLVTFLDSSGLCLLVDVLKKINTLEGELKLCGIQEQPNELLSITQLCNLFTVVDNCERD